MAPPPAEDWVAVVLAGGRGSRLAPYTTVVPKPLLPVGDRAILDIVIRQLQRAGCADVVVAVSHLGHLVQAVLGDGSRHGVPVRFHEEEAPLGTAGALRHIEGLDDTFLMMNGDVLTSLDHASLIAAHQEAGNVLTIATHQRVVESDYGVLHTRHDAGPTERVTAYDEKPSFSLTVSMGVYVLEPAAIAHVPEAGAFDLPDLVISLLEAGRPVGAFPHDGYWLDIGRQDDYERATRDADALLAELLPGDASLR